MKMLIATLPSIHKTELIEKIVRHPMIDGVRYNIGARSAYPPYETLEKILEVTKKEGKKLWVDLKGRQLRIKQWADPTYGDIILNHEIEVDLPARIFFRGNEWSNIVAVQGDKIFVDPDPPSALGAGQAVNVHGENLKIKGYSTEQDFTYMDAAFRLGISNFMLSFVECADDIAEIKRFFGCYPPVESFLNLFELVLKIESPKGMEFVEKNPVESLEDCRLMTARDDLMINIGDNKAQIIKAAELIVNKDPDAILASHLFMGLQKDGMVSTADISDLRLIHLMGYKHFMFSDGISHYHFDAAMKAWKDYWEIFN